MQNVGSNIPRVDGFDKVTGKAKYVDDIEIPNMWHGAVVRSTIPHGRVKSVTLDPSFDWSRVVTADKKDIPGKNCVAMIEQDVPLIADEVIKHVGEAVLLVAAPTRELAHEARRHVKVEYERWEPILTVEDAKAARVKIRGDDNVMSRYTINKGDVAKGLKAADVVVEGRYSTGHQEHAYIETQGMIAAPRDGGGFDVIGSMQCPYYISKAVSILMGLPESSFSIRQAAVGGAFGGKEDYPSILAGYCLVLAKKAGRPVKIVFDRVEDIEATTRRHPAVIYHKTGVKKDGTITAMEIRVEMDAGAYSTMTPVVLSRGLIHSTGPYSSENIHIEGRAYATNTPPNGAFRGFGVPQVIFGAEVHMDRVAAAIGMSPYEFRKRNCFHIGDVTATGQKFMESVAAEKVLDAAVKRSQFASKTGEFSRNRGGDIRRGIGMALFWHGAAFTGSGEERIKARAALRLDPDGRVVVLAAATEMGQGSHTVLQQITADALGVDMSCVRMETPDTALVPNSGPTVASRTTMIVGDVLMKCADSVKDALLSFASEEYGERKTALKFDRCDVVGAKGRIASVCDLIKAYLKSGGARSTFEEGYVLPPDIKWNEAKHEGDAYPAYAWGCDIAEVEVDMDTFEVRVVKMWLVSDAGRAVNPVMAEGQVEGGTVQGVGYGLLENFVMKDGAVQTNRLQTYLIPTSLDAPEMETAFVDEPCSLGPMGAKGIGEMPMNGAAPAIANAIANATGLEMNEIPITPERLYEAWRMKQAGCEP